MTVQVVRMVAAVESGVVEQASGTVHEGGQAIRAGQEAAAANREAVVAVLQMRAVGGRSGGRFCTSG